VHGSPNGYSHGQPCEYTLAKNKHQVNGYGNKNSDTHLNALQLFPMRTAIFHTSHENENANDYSTEI